MHPLPDRETRWPKDAARATGLGASLRYRKIILILCLVRSIQFNLKVALTNLIFIYYSHSVVAGGFGVKSYNTLDIPATLLISATISLITCKIRCLV